MSIWRYANPAEFMRITGPLVLPLWVLAAVAMIVSTVWGLSVSPDKDQDDSIHILFVHVPAALLAINTYFIMAVASVIGLVRRHHVSFLVAKAAAPIGAAFTMIAYFTGYVWGIPIWDASPTHAVWLADPKLLAMAIMFFFYVGYMALWATIEEPEKAADLSAVLCLVGVIFAFLSRYAVLLFPSIHQDASLTAVEPGQRVDDAYRTPLFFAMAAYYVLFFALLLTRARTEIRLRRLRAQRLVEA